MSTFFFLWLKWVLLLLVQASTTEDAEKDIASTVMGIYTNRGDGDGVMMQWCCKIMIIVSNLIDNFCFDAFLDLTGDNISVSYTLDPVGVFIAFQ